VSTPVMAIGPSRRSSQFGNVGWRCERGHGGGCERSRGRTAAARVGVWVAGPTRRSRAWWLDPV